MLVTDEDDSDDVKGEDDEDAKDDDFSFSVVFWFFSIISSVESSSKLQPVTYMPTGCLLSRQQFWGGNRSSILLRGYGTATTHRNILVIATFGSPNSSPKTAGPPGFSALG